MSRKRIDLSKRQRRIHPHKVWKAILRLKTMDKLGGLGDQLFYSPHKIASVLFENWDDFSQRDQNWVVSSQVMLPLLFLKVEGWVQSDKIRVSSFGKPKGTMIQEGYKDINEFKATPSPFRGIEGIDDPMAEQMEFNSIDRQWAFWIGRRGYQRRFIATIDPTI